MRYLLGEVTIEEDIGALLGEVARRTSVRSSKKKQRKITWHARKITKKHKEIMRYS